MAPRLPRISGKELVARLEKHGWTLVRRKGSHQMMTKPGYRYTLSIPDHKELGPGILRAILRHAGLRPEDL